MSSAALKKSTRLSKTLLTPDQQAAVTRLYETDETLLVAEMGAGKTIIALTAVEELLSERILSRVLVVAPVKVANNVWSKEFDKWIHTSGLRINVATGNEKQRHDAFMRDSDILVINFENLPWFFKRYGKDHHCDGLVIDELSRLKSSGGAQFKSLRHKLKTFSWRVGMTGTPVSEDYLGLFAQAMVCDQGTRLGTNFQIFKRKYFYATDYQGYNWEIRGEREEKALMHAVSDLIHIVPGYSETLPELVKRQHTVIMPDQAWDVYTTLAKDGIAEGVTADNAAVLSGKLQQIASGFLYQEDDEAITLHHAKLDACRALVDATEGNTVIAYWYQHDRDALLAAFPGADCLGSGVSKSETARIIERWNSGETKVLLLHPKSAGHGLQLEQGGADLIFYGPIWSRDAFDQTVARLWRQGQRSAVHVTTLVVAGSVDELIVARSGVKKEYYERFKAHLEGV